MTDVAPVLEDIDPLVVLKELEELLDKRRGQIGAYEDYYSGRHRLNFATSKFREAFGSLFSAFADNWCQLVVNASVERLQVTGFRFGQEQQGDEEAWRIWQSSNMDAASKLAHTEAVKLGEAFLLVSPNDIDPQTPRITVEHPSQVYVKVSPAQRTQREAAIKKWLDSSGLMMATLYTPFAVYRFQSERPVRSATDRITWVPRAEDPFVDNPLLEVPMIPMQNAPSLLGGGMSDLDNVIPLQDAVNKLVSDMIVASEYAAFRQRWATGIEIPRDPTTGKPMTEQFLSSVSRMWTVAAEDAKFGDFDVTDLGNYVRAVEMTIQHIAAQTRTPPHYLLGQSGAFPSGESLKSTETGLVAKVVDKQVAFSESYEEVMRLAFLLKGDQTRGLAVDAETLWRDPESRTEGEHIDAILKMKALNLPDEILWERAGFSPQQIARIKQINEELAAQAAALAAASQTPPVNVNLHGKGSQRVETDGLGNITRIVEED